MRRDDGEFDYLAEAQLEVDPDSFIQVVKEAFLLEHGLSQNQDIAQILGVDKSRVSQIFKDPANLKPETVRMILAKIRRREHRRRIAKAWMLACFDEVIDDPHIGRVTGRRITEKTVRRVDRMIRQSRLTAAANTAAEASAKAGSVVLRERLLDRACWARQRLDEPGRAMEVVRLIIEGARERRDVLREAAGHLLRLRILIGLADCRPEEVQPIFAAAARLIHSSAPPTAAPVFMVGTPRWLGSMQDSVELAFMERGVKPKDAAFLERLLTRALAEAKSGKSHQERYGAWQTASRVYTLQGQFFQAQEAVDRAFQAGGMKNLNAYEMSSLISGRILLRTDGPEAAAQYLHTASHISRRQMDRYHMRLVEWELARAVNLLL